jgi:hypothetical protein
MKHQQQKAEGIEGGAEGGSKRGEINLLSYTLEPAETKVRIAAMIPPATTAATRHEEAMKVKHEATKLLTTTRKTIAKETAPSPGELGRRRTGGDREGAVENCKKVKRGYFLCLNDRNAYILGWEAREYKIELQGSIIFTCKTATNSNYKKVK